VLFFKLRTIPWRRIGEWRYSSTHSLTSALDGGEWSPTCPGRFTPRERVPVTHWTGGWEGSRAVLDAVKRKIPSATENQTLEPRSSSQQRRRYTDWAITALPCYNTNNYIPICHQEENSAVHCRILLLLCFRFRHRTNFKFIKHSLHSSTVWHRSCVVCS
jgi:hypothetical protein